MKHFIAFIATMGAVAYMQGATVPYASDMCEDEAWTVVDSNDDGTTWDDLYDDYYIKDSGFEYGKYYKYSRKNGADDWLVSPAVTLEAGKKYTVSFWCCARDEWESFSLSMANSNTVEALSAEDAVMYDYPTGDYDKASTDCQKIVCTVVAEASGDFYFGFHAKSEADGSGIYLTGFDIREFAFVPAPVADLKAEAASDGTVACLVSWTIPAVDADGQPLPDGVKYEKVELYRDDTLIATLTNGEVSYSDTAENGLASGIHTYRAVAYAGGVGSAPVEVRSGYIGTVGALPLPWNVESSALTTDDFEAYWKVVKGDGSTVPAEYGWQRKQSSIQFDPRSKNNVEDDWLVLPRLDFKEPGIYRLKINARYSAESGNPMLDVHFGTNAVPTADERKLGQFASIPEEAGDVWVAFRVTEPGEYFIALHACRSELESARPIEIYNLTVERWKELPLNITDFTVETMDNSAKLSWRNPSLTNVGEPIGTIARIEVKRNDMPVATLTENLTPGEVMTYVDTPEQGGIFTYTVVPYLSDDAAPESAPVAVATDWIGDKTRALPYTVDFASSPSVVELSALWNVEDNDGDGVKWSVSSNYFTLQFDADGGTSHDVLLTPPFSVSNGHAYNVTFSATGGQDELPLSAELRYEAVMAGENAIARQPEGETQASHEVLLSGSDVYEDYAMSVKSAKDGHARIAISTNPEYEYSMDLDPVRINKVKVEDGGDKTGVSEISVEPSSVPVRYYDMTGVKVAHPKKGNIYIRIDGDGKASKMIL